MLRDVEMWKPTFLSRRLKRRRDGWCTWLVMTSDTSEMTGRPGAFDETEAMARAEKETRRSEQVEFRLHQVTETLETFRDHVRCT